ncbi:hypothetical protein KAH37_07250 [bacterium]|nr:hypothetical protein [bacterium]
MIRAITILLLCCTLFVACSEKSSTTQTLFTQGERVESGLIWKGEEINKKELIKEYKRVEIYREDFTTPKKSEWNNLGGQWEFKEGKLFSPEAKNRNFVLQKPLPQDAIISLTLRSESEGVDIKFNAWGDGKQHEHGDGYSFILGGWSNRVSVISRLHEHEKGRVENRTKLKKGVEYRCEIIRKGGEIYWFVNNKLFLVYFDKKPLKIEDGQRYFSLGNWKSSVWIDNILIEKLQKR